MQAPSTNQTCPVCDAGTRKTTGKELYPGNWKTFDQIFLVCENFPRCNTYVGCHSSGVPKGPLSPRPLRLAKVKAHETFDRIWKEGPFKRSEAYQLLAEHLGVKEAHIGWMTEAECYKAMWWAIEVFLDWEEHQQTRRRAAGETKAP